MQSYKHYRSLPTAATCDYPKVEWMHVAWPENWGANLQILATCAERDSMRGCERERRPIGSSGWPFDGCTATVFVWWHCASNHIIRNPSRWEPLQLDTGVTSTSSHGTVTEDILKCMIYSFREADCETAWPRFFTALIFHVCPGRVSIIRCPSKLWLSPNGRFKFSSGEAVLEVRESLVAV